MQQCPTDLWVYQELIFRTRPEVFVEVGVKRGGLTRYVADLLELLHSDDPEAARVVAVDLHVRDAAREAVGADPRVTLIEGSSTADEVVEQVRARCAGRRALVLLDSDHRAKHVRAELELYAPLVPVDGYLIVNDTNINGHLAAPAFGPGPYEAVDDFLAATDAFEIDPECEKHMLTLCPRGYLRRVRPNPQ
jgi:cephalosporin hydroxylase